MRKFGFTVVELLVVIALIGILVTLGVLNIDNTQVKARDTERKTDIEIIASHLETYYTNGTENRTTLGRYPSTAIVSNPTGYLRDIDTDALVAPNIDTIEDSFVVATNNTQTTAGVQPQPTIDQYVYQPLLVDNSLCTNDIQECRKFNLYYHLEDDDTIYMTTSKHQ